MAILGQYNIDDYKCGMFDTSNPHSPFFIGPDVEEIPQCDFCLEEMEDQPMILTFNIVTKKPEFMCTECAECMDHEFHINIKIKQHGHFNKKINYQTVNG